MGGRRLSSRGCSGKAEVSASPMNGGLPGRAGTKATAMLNAGAAQEHSPSSQQGMESGAAAVSPMAAISCPWQSAGSDAAVCAHAIGLPRFSNTASRANIQGSRRIFTPPP